MGSTKTKVTLNLETDKLADLRLHAARRRIYLSDAVNDAIDLLIAKVTSEEMLGFGDDGSTVLKPTGEYWKPGEDPPKLKTGRPPGS